jgi:hypothetical protein
MREITPMDRLEITVGRELPFSIYAADRTLLLAAGRMVPNDFVREGLLRGGVYCDGGGAASSDTAKAAKLVERVTVPMEALMNDYRHTAARAQVGFRMEKEANGTAYTSRVMGVSERGGLLMTPPTTADGGSVELKVGDTWTFRAMYAISALRFNATIAKVDSDPLPYFYLPQLQNVERRDVRKWPRVPTCLKASREGDTLRVIVDLGVGGARIGVDHQMALQKGQEILLNPTVRLLQKDLPLSIEATVLNLYGRADPKHAGVDFYGVQFQNSNDIERLSLHAYVQEHLCAELDRVWHLLSIPPVTP